MHGRGRLRGRQIETVAPTALSSAVGPQSPDGELVGAGFKPAPQSTTSFALLHDRSAKSRKSSRNTLRARPPPPLEVCHEEGERRGGDAVEPGGLADGARAQRDELLADLIREAAKLGVVETLRQLQAFVAPVSSDIRRLPGKVHVVFGFDLQLLGDFGGKLAKARPDRREPRNPDIRVGQELKGGAPLAVLVEGEPMALRLRGGERNRAGKLPRCRKLRHFLPVLA